MYHTDKYNITGVDKTVKCACISDLAVIAAGHHKRKNLTKYLEFKIQKSDFGRQKNKKIFTKIYRPY